MASPAVAPEIRGRRRSLDELAVGNLNLQFLLAPDEDEAHSPPPSAVESNSKSPVNSPSTSVHNSSATDASSPRSILEAASADEVDAEIESRRSLFPGEARSPSGGSPKAKGHRIKACRINKLSSTKVASLLNGFPFFHDFEDGVVAKLADVVEQAKYPAGTLLFRQDDPPGNCYVIVSGSLGVFVKQSTEDEGGDTPAKSRRSIQVRNLDDNESTVARPAFFSSNPLIDQDLDDMVCRRLTVEGFSLYHSASDLGVKVATIQAGSLTGEIALLQDQPRTATLKCMEDTSFIIIGRMEFESVLKAEMQRVRQQKVDFMLAHLPGLKDVPVMRGRPHPTYYFSKVSMTKGHEFLKQGQVADDAIFVVLRGSVEFRRSETTTNVTSTPCQEAAMKLSRARAPVRSASGLRSLSSCGKLCDDSAGKPKRMRRIGTLQAGGVFGSLPLTEPEPFTVVASSSVEVYSITQDIARLPRRLLNSVQQYLTQASTWRLGRLNSCRSADTLQQQHFLLRTRPKPYLDTDIGLSLLLSGRLHPPPSFRNDAPHPGLPTPGTVKFASQPRRQRPQSAPAGERGLKVEVTVGFAGPNQAKDVRCRPASAPSAKKAVAERLNAPPLATKMGKPLSRSNSAPGKRPTSATGGGR